MLPFKWRFLLRQDRNFWRNAGKISSPDVKHIYFLINKSNAFNTKASIDQEALNQNGDKNKDGQIKWAIVVPKRHGRAHQRLKTKRRIRSAINELMMLNQNSFSGSYKIVVITVGQYSETIDYYQEINTLFKKLENRFLAKSRSRKQ